MTTRSRTARERRANVAVAVTLLTLCTGAAPAGAEPEEPAEVSSCPVVAAAQAVSTTLQKDGDLVLARPVGGQAPAAQVCLNAALVDSTAYASAAYPGDTVVAAPGAAADFPGYVASSYPGTPEAKADSAAFMVRARSSESTSEATAETGPPSVGIAAGHASAQAKGSVNSTTGTATAQASTLSAPLAVADVLTLGEVHSAAGATARPDGTIERSSSLEVGRTTVAGQVVTITAAGVQAAGQTVPLSPTQNVTDALTQAGITVTYLSAQKTTGGVISAGVSVRVVAQDAAGVRTVTSYVLGRSFAAVTPVEGESGQGSTPNVPPSAPTPGGATDSAPLGQGSSGVAPGVGAPVEGPGPDVPGPAPSVSAGPQLAAEGPRALVSSRKRATLGTFYLVLVAGGLVLLVSSTSMRLLGVRTRWI